MIFSGYAAATCQWTITNIVLFIILNGNNSLTWNPGAQKNATIILDLSAIFSSKFKSPPAGSFINSS